MNSSDLIQLQDPGYDWSLWPWAFIGLGVALVGMIVSLLAHKLSSSRSGANAAWAVFRYMGVLAIILTVVSPGVAGIIGATIYGNKVDDMKLAEMAKLGYNAVQFDRNSDEIFTAYRDGKMVRGVSLKLEPLTWQVVQIDTPDFK